MNRSHFYTFSYILYIAVIEKNSLVVQHCTHQLQRFFSSGLTLKNLPRKCMWLVALNLLILGGCGTPEKYREDHQLTNLHVVFVDNDTLHDEWTARTGQSGVEFMASRGSSNFPQVKTLKGFFDFTTNTLFCPKWNFEVCGHELHHAALGHFHQPH